MSDRFVPGNLAKWSHEVSIGENLVYLVTGNPILIEGQQAGQALLITDITQTKLTDSRKSEIVTTVSHELRSPLTLIHGYAKILQLTGNLNEQQDTYIGNIIAEVEEMRSLVQNLLDMGRLESEHALDLTRIEAGEIVNSAIKSMEAQARQKNIQINVSLPKSPIYFEADETFLAQALKNLIENAIKFSKMGREVTLSVQLNPDNVVFEVKDEGIGISPLDQRHLFKKFQRMSNPVGQNQQGSGLGLAIVKSIAERHGGKVWFDSQLGKGSTFYLQIPVKSLNR
jgi:signal transduction histidine kinase